MWIKTSYYSCILLLITYYVYTLPSLAVTSFVHFSYRSITFNQCETKCPGINCYCKHQSSSAVISCPSCFHDDTPVLLVAAEFVMKTFD